jgi:hypothetical protein
MTAVTTAETFRAEVTCAVFSLGDTDEHGAGRQPGVRAPGRRHDGRDPRGRPRGLRRGPGDARGDAPDNVYLRFFSYSPQSAETEARRICRDPDTDTPGSAALLALRDGELVGVASYAGLIGHPGQAEVAFAEASHMHHMGIATLLLEHLVPLARSRQITTFTAEDAASCCCGSPGSPTTCPRSPSST